ncbi:Type II secretion system protein [uncultured Thiomicrorhabdus sp.]
MRQKGFSLLELSIALAILGVILYGVSLSKSSMRFFDSYKENQRLVGNVEKVFHTFVQVNGFLPCPDSTDSGRENREVTGECTAIIGKVPFLDLGISANDEWWSSLYYAVNQNANDSAMIADSNNSASYFNSLTTPAAAFDISTPPIGVLGGPQSGSGNYTVCREFSAACDSSSANVIEHAAIAVIVSFGDNAGVTWSGAMTGLNSAEQENSNNDNYFWQTYDDQLFWITGYDMKYAILRSEKGLLDIP